MGLLEVDRDRVVDARADASFAEPTPHQVTVVDVDREDGKLVFEPLDLFSGHELRVRARTVKRRQHLVADLAVLLPEIEVRDGQGQLLSPRRR